MQRKSRRVNAGLLLLFSQIAQIGITNIPPVTLASLALNIFLFLNPVKSLRKTCISVEECFEQGDWQRLLLSPFHHADDWHLYFNMVSMLWKGMKLEKRLGSGKFAIIIASFSVLIGIVYMILEFALAEFLAEPAYKMQCAVGFSGVLFALKVLNNHYHPGGSVNLMGFPVSNKYSCWVELVAIHLLSPGTSFAGHLAGILVGLMYTLGPLKTILERCAGVFSLNGGYSERQHYYNNAGYSGYRSFHSGRSGYQWETPRNYDAYTGGLSEREQLDRALRASLSDRGYSSYDRQPYGVQHRPGWLSEEDMRRQRLNRFDR
ncbi:rhomboid-related protein 4 [Tachyglossus aculeatus]|uniref:rhomboid-related protein 4 n=1 Tax=Tachyglossus aculeatus TaxID=9261 RepID=UPI0018F76A72|nr:rhomboid-related protein 4 [Tachyglossus aculeatus]